MLLDNVINAKIFGGPGLTKKISTLSLLLPTSPVIRILNCYKTAKIRT